MNCAVGQLARSMPDADKPLLKAVSPCYRAGGQHNVNVPDIRAPEIPGLFRVVRMAMAGLCKSRRLSSQNLTKMPETRDTVRRTWSGYRPTRAARVAGPCLPAKMCKETLSPALATLPPGVGSWLAIVLGLLRGLRSASPCRQVSPVERRPSKQQEVVGLFSPPQGARVLGQTNKTVRQGK